MDWWQRIDLLLLLFATTSFSTASLQQRLADFFDFFAARESLVSTIIQQNGRILSATYEVTALCTILIGVETVKYRLKLHNETWPSVHISLSRINNCACM